MAALTSDDLDGLGADAMAAKDPRPIRDGLVAAAEQDRIADPTDVSYAFALASEISESCGEHDRALELAGQAVSAAQGTPHLTDVRSSRADLLLRGGYDDEGMRELHALRPQLSRDPLAAAHLVDVLVAHGRAETAEQWLTAALATARDVAGRADDGSEASDEAWEVVDELAAHRRDVRADLGREPDEDDLEVDALDALDDGPDMTFWPRAAHEALLAAHPEYAEHLGVDWDEHRAWLEQGMQEFVGQAPVVEVATPAYLAAALADEPPAAPPEPGPLLEWPPGRNDPCWCTSGTKYKKCCLPRAR